MTRDLDNNSQIILDGEKVGMMILGNREFIPIKEVLRLIDEGKWEKFVPLLRKYDALEVKPRSEAWGRPASYISRSTPPGQFEVLPENIETFPHS